MIESKWQISLTCIGIIDGPKSKSTLLLYIVSFLLYLLVAAGKKVSLPGIRIGRVLPLLMCYDANSLANRDISFQSRQLNPTECSKQTWAVLQWKGQPSLPTNSLDYGHAYRVSSTCSISVEPSGELSQNILHYLLPLAKKIVMMDVFKSSKVLFIKIRTTHKL